MDFQPAAMDSLESLRTWFDIAPDAMLAVDEAGRIVLTNRRAEGLFGYDAGGLDGLAVEDLVPVVTRDTHVGLRSSYGARPRVRSMGVGRELQACARDGRHFPVEIGLSPIRIGDHLVTMASIRDLSGTQRVRRALERSRRDAMLVQIGRLTLETSDYEVAIRRIPEMVLSACDARAVAILSTDGRPGELHARAATGLSGDAIDALTDLLSDAQLIRRFFVTREYTAITSQELQLEEFAPIRLALAGMGFDELACVPLFGRHEPMGMLAALGLHGRGIERDQVDFLQTVAHLLTAAVRRSRSEAQLAHAQKLEALGQLTGGIAHDFNNLLTVVSGNLQLLDMELSGDPELREIIASALRAVDRGADLTRRLLAFARRQSLQPRAVVLQPLMAELAQMLARTLGEDVRIEVACDADVPDVFADPTELDTALVNLALNARDAMPRGGCLRLAASEVHVSAPDNGWKVPTGCYVAFEVDDTGTGMSGAVAAHALDPFFTTKENGKGSGLGLSMVYGFVTQSGGGLTLESRLGFGTQVAFLLPVAAAGQPYAGVADPEPHGLPAGGRTVLVVEDEADVARIAIRFLQAMGYEVIATDSAREALALLIGPTPIDVLFSDVVLGSGMNGRELAVEARRLRPHLPVLLVSGYPGPTGRVGTDDNEGIELLRKPYRREELANALRRVVERG